MTSSAQGRRRPRLSDAETELRMLEAGARFVGSQGLSLSLEHLSIEDLIRDADVSRTSSYRRWPTKDRYAADLLLHLARTTRLTDDFSAYEAALRSIDPALLTGLDDPQRHRDLIVEAFRLLTQADYELSLASTPWRNYVMLRAAHAGLPDGELRARIADALRATESAFRTHRARALEGSCAAIGYRLTSPDALGWDDLAQLLTATFTGVLVQALSEPDAVLATAPRRPFGSSHTADWSLAALASANVFFSATEPDPQARLDERILAAVTEGLASLWGSPSPDA